MLKLWIKLIVDHRIVQHDVFFAPESAMSSDDALSEAMRDPCMQLDVPVPVILQKHMNDFSSFNRVVFRRCDFMEHTSFDTMELEVINEKEKKKEFDSFGVGF